VTDIVVDGRVKVYLVPTISNINSPTTAELNAGTQVDNLLTPDGLIGFEAETQAVDTTALNSTFNTKAAGRADYTGTMLRLKKQSGTDALYNAYPRDTPLYVVIRRDGSLASTAWGTGQKVGVFPATTGERRDLAPAANEVQKWEMPLFISNTPNQTATIA
jgi:hypothetical protein